MDGRKNRRPRRRHDSQRDALLHTCGDQIRVHVSYPESTLAPGGAGLVSSHVSIPNLKILTHTRYP